MKICIISRYFQAMSRNSDSDLLWPLLKEMAALGHEIYVLAQKSNSGRALIERKGIKIYFLNQTILNPTREDFEIALIDKVSQIQKESEIDLIHAYDNSVLALKDFRLKNKIKIIIDVDALKISKLFSILSFDQDSVVSHIKVAIKAVAHFIRTFFTFDRDLLKMADRVLVSSAQQRFFLERYYAYPDSRISFAPRAFSLPAQSVQEGDIISLLPVKNLPYKNVAKFIVNITDMSLAEETIYLLKAFERLAVKKSSVYLVIIGTGPSYKKIEYELYNLALGNRAFLLGDITPEETSMWIEQSSVLVDLSSLYRQFENYSIEGMLRKKIVIASELGPLAHIIEDGHEGFLVRPADWSYLGHLMGQIIEDTDAYNKITQQAFEKASLTFAPDNVVGRVLDSYKKLLIESFKK